MPDFVKRSSRWLASKMRSLRGWVFRNRMTLRIVIGTARFLFHIWSILLRVGGDLWPFYVGVSGHRDATRSTAIGACVPRP